MQLSGMTTNVALSRSKPNRPGKLDVVRRKEAKVMNRLTKMKKRWLGAPKRNGDGPER
jgi:hypothetical protein